MSSNKLTPAAIQEQLELILSSRDFHASPRLKKFFRFLVEETLAGRSAQLKGYTIATTIFNRPEDFDSQADPIVRVEAAKLRSRLEHYYALCPDAPVLIELPKGSYVPVFSDAELSRGRPGAGAFSKNRIVEEAPEMEQPGVAVLPFTFTSDSDCTDYFSDGLAEGITINLTKFDDLAVANSYSTRLAWQNSTDLYGLAKTLEVRFILHGSVKITGEHIRVYAELADLETKSNVWAEKFDGCLTASDLFTIQDGIIQQVTSRIAGCCGLIKRTLLKESSGKQPGELSAYDAILLYHHWAPSFKRDRFVVALTALEQTLRADPEHSLASAVLADLYASDYQFGYDLRPNGLEESLPLANHAVSLNPGCQFAYWALALNYFLRQDLYSFRRAASRIIPLNPANTYALTGCGLLVGMAEDLSEGLSIIKKAVQLNPNLPSWHHIIPFMAHYNEGNYDAALTEALHINTPDCFWDSMLRAAVYGRLGMREEGLAALQELMRLQPSFVEHNHVLLQSLLFSEQHVDAVRAGLVAAGLKGL